MVAGGSPRVRGNAGLAVMSNFNDFNDALRANGPEAIEQFLASAQTYDPTDRSTRGPQWLDELSLEAQLGWVIKGLIARPDLGLLYGAPNTGKSFLAIDLAAHIAIGLEWCGLKVTPGAVLYMALEGGRGLKARLIAQRLRHKFEIDAKRVRVPLAVWSTSLDLCNGEAAQALAREAGKFSEDAGLPIALIIIDTLARAMGGGDENSSRDMSVLISNCALVQGMTGAHVMLVHHQGKVFWAWAERPLLPVCSCRYRHRGHARREDQYLDRHSGQTEGWCHGGRILFPACPHGGRQGRGR